MIKRYFTIKEFASLLNCNRTTIGRAIKCGRIQAFRIGQGKKSSWRIPETELIRIEEFDLLNIVNIEVEKRLKERDAKD